MPILLYRKINRLLFIAVVVNVVKKLPPFLVKKDIKYMTLIRGLMLGRKLVRIRINNLFVNIENRREKVALL